MCLVWGSTWIAIKIGLDDLSPVFFAGSRFAVAAIVLGVICKLQKFSLRISKKEFKLLLFMSAFMMAIPYALVFWGEQHTNSAMGAMLMCAMAG